MHRNTSDESQTEIATAPEAPLVFQMHSARFSRRSRRRSSCLKLSFKMRIHANPVDPVKHFSDPFFHAFFFFLFFFMFVVSLMVFSAKAALLAAADFD